LKIALITGGPSSERDVSIASSISILNALRENGHDVKVIDPVFGKAQPSESVILGHGVRKESPTPEELVRVNKNFKRNILECFSGETFNDIEFAFLGLHGKFGEDGGVQSLLEMLDIPYSGSGVFASALAMDKDISKIVLSSKGIKTPAWISAVKEDKIGSKKLDETVRNNIGYPCVVKPNDEGSTVGLTILHQDNGAAQLDEAADLAFTYSRKLLIEQYVRGRELTVPVMGDVAYPVIEIRPIGGFYDYEHKYTKGMTEYFCPAELDPDIEEYVKQAALKAHYALGCSVYSRVDFMLDDKNVPYCLEVNTLPGMTQTSLVPKSALANGLTFKDLIQMIIELSLQKN
jgi:D-alanine-D-alanine ligase